MGAPERRAYGPMPIETLDLYRTERANAPVNIYIHGGGWRVSVAKMYAFPAELFVHAGAHWVVPNFNWVQDVGDSLMPLADQVRRAVAWVYRNAKSFGGDPNRIYVSGHSAGGHLASVILTTDWQKLHDLPPDIVKGGLCCSGMFDLEPVALSARRHYIKFTDEMVEALSPQRHLDKLSAPVIVAYGSLETPEFQRQSRDFAAVSDGGGQEHEAYRRQRVQPLRDHRDPGQSLRCPGPRRARADGLGGVLTMRCSMSFNAAISASMSSGVLK